MVVRNMGKAFHKTRLYFFGSFATLTIRMKDEIYSQTAADGCV